ncbi:hypothetical protein QFZ48_000143 [Chitinophaga sp. W2I13]
MTEVLHVMRDRDCLKKIIPVLDDNAKIFTPTDRLAYVIYWNQYLKKLEDEISGLNPLDTLKELKKVRIARSISQEVNSFLNIISNMLLFKISLLDIENYAKLTTYMKEHSPGK